MRRDKSMDKVRPHRRDPDCKAGQVHGLEGAGSPCGKASP